MRTARLYACFPHLLNFELEDEWLMANGISKYYAQPDDEEKNSWVYKCLDDIDKSPKLRAIRSLIGRLQQNEPMPFFATGPVGAFVLYMVSDNSPIIS